MTDTPRRKRTQRETAEDNLQDAHQRLEDYGKTVDFLASAAIEDHERTLPWLDEDVSKAIDKAEQAKWEREAISARARGDYAAERHALDMLALAEREIVGPSPFAARSWEANGIKVDWPQRLCDPSEEGEQ